MPNQPQPAPGTNQPQVDPTALNLARAIRQVESGDNPNAKGASGEFGIGQWMPGNFESAAQKYGLDPTDKSQGNQEHVLYNQVEEQLKAGHSQSEIASWWNSGKYDPTGNVGVNKEGVAYNTPAYVEKVKQAYLQASQGQRQTAPVGQTVSQGQYAPPTPPDGQTQTSDASSSYAPPAPPTTIAPTGQTPQAPQESFMGDLSQGNYGGAALQAGKGLVNTVLGAPESLGTHLGQLAAGGTADIAGALGATGLQQHIQQKLQQPVSTLIGGQVQPLKSGLGGAEQIGGDALQTALLAAGPEAGVAKSVLGRIGTNVAIGAGFGAGGAMSEGGTWQDVLQQAGVGAATGGIIGGAGELLNKAAQYLPQRIARTFIPGLNAETAQYAVDRGLGAPQTMLDESNKNLSKVGAALGNAVKQASGPATEAQMIPGQQLFEKIANDPAIKDAGMNGQDIADTLKKLVPLKKDLVNRVFMGDGTLEDLQRLNSSIGKATYKTVFDDPAVKAGKDVGNVAYHSFGNIIKTAAPDAAPFFDEYSKELQLNGALSKAVRRGEKARPFTLRDIVAMFAGMPAGPVGMATTFGLEKAATSPTVNLRTAGLMSKLLKPSIQTAGQFAKAPLISGATGLMGNLMTGK